jgi:hypothetical protein
LCSIVAIASSEGPFRKPRDDFTFYLYLELTIYNLRNTRSVSRLNVSLRQIMDEQEKKLVEKYGKLPMKKSMLSGMKVRPLSLAISPLLLLLEKRRSINDLT